MVYLKGRSDLESCVAYVFDLPLFDSEISNC